MRRTLLSSWALSATLGFASGCTVASTPMLSPRDGGIDAAPIDASIDAPPRDGGFSCAPGAPGCWGDVHYVCGEDDTRADEIVCEDACHPQLGCVTCVPNARRCEGDVSMVCNATGTAWLTGRDCGDWGSTCGASGLCEDDCADAEAIRSYIGCEYWPVPLANGADLDPRFDFRVVVANPSRASTEVTISRGGRFVTREEIPPGGVAEIALDWIDDVSFPFSMNEWESVVTAHGAYRLIATQPVIVTQFNPFQYALGGRNSFSNDASLLLPSHALGTEHVAASYVPLSIVEGYTEGAPSYARLPGYIAVVGVSPAPTRVDIEVAGDVAADRGGRWAATARGGTISFTLARGEVAQIAAAVPPGCAEDRPGYVRFSSDTSNISGACREEQFDLTGSRIVSDRPVSVFGGHTCAYVPYGTAACDHLETTLAPVDTWGRTFRTMPLRDPETTAANLVRIMAAHDGTALTLTPPLPIERTTLDAGEWVELSIEGPLMIEGSEPIQVAQLLLGQNVTDPPLERGDPGLTILVPEEQYRAEYVFVTPSSYTPVANGQSYLLVAREPGAAITLDGAALDATWSAIGGRELAIVPITGGSHRATSSTPFGLIAYGLGSYTSYAYPAGLDLRVIPF